MRIGRVAAHREPVLVQTLRPTAAVEGLGESTDGRAMLGKRRSGGTRRITEMAESLYANRSNSKTLAASGGPERKARVLVHNCIGDG